MCEPVKMCAKRWQKATDLEREPMNTKEERAEDTHQLKLYCVAYQEAQKENRWIMDFHPMEVYEQADDVLYAMCVFIGIATSLPPYATRPALVEALRNHRFTAFQEFYISHAHLYVR